MGCEKEKEMKKKKMKREGEGVCCKNNDVLIPFPSPM